MIISTSQNRMLTAISMIMICLTATFSFAQDVAILKYKGGGDWYSNPTALPNLVKFCNDNINTNINENIQTVEANSIDIFQFPMLHMTGHGNVFFNDEGSKNLRDYLISGGFLHIDDNYGMEPYVRKELKKVFPNNDLIEIPKDHAIFNSAYKFPNGLPKIHEHDGKAPQAFGIFHETRLILLFTFETDLGDGWEDREVHNDSEDVREKALRMGANIIKYAFEN
jgi:hypothetical protein